jgi:hypothetical protein
VATATRIGPSAGEQLGQQGARRRRGARVLGVVDDQRQWLHEQLGQGVRDLRGQGARIDALAGHHEPLAEDVDRARHRAPQRAEDARDQRAGIVALGAAHPGAGESAALHGGLESGRLGEARAGHDEHRSAPERVGQSLLQPTPGNPRGRSWHGGSI